MPRRARYEPLNVFLNSRFVGQLRRETSGAILFQYDRSWLVWQPALPVSLSLPLREQPYVGAPVLAVFENLLPDNDSLRRQIAVRARAEGTDAYSLLGAIGLDCVGALQFLPPDVQPTPARAIDAVPVSGREIGVILENLAMAPLGITEDESFRISIAGAQEKTALLRWKDRWCKPRGTTPTTHIFKPGIGKLPNGVDLTSTIKNAAVGVSCKYSRTVVSESAQDALGGTVSPPMQTPSQRPSRPSRQRTNQLVLSPVPRVALASCSLGRKQNFDRAGFSTWGDFEPYQDQARKAPVPMCKALARTLNELRRQANTARDEDFVFA